MHMSTVVGSCWDLNARESWKICEPLFHLQFPATTPRLTPLKIHHFFFFCCRLSSTSVSSIAILCYETCNDVLRSQPSIQLTWKVYQLTISFRLERAEWRRDSPRWEWKTFRLMSLLSDSLLSNAYRTQGISVGVSLMSANSSRPWIEVALVTLVQRGSSWSCPGSGS